MRILQYFLEQFIVSGANQIGCGGYVSKREWSVADADVKLHQALALAAYVSFATVTT